MNLSPLHLESIGHLCQSLQSPFARIRRVVDALGISPAVTINGVEHFDEQQCEQIADYLRLHANGTNEIQQRVEGLH